MKGGTMRLLLTVLLCVLAGAAAAAPSDYAPLPKPPAGWGIREVAQMPEQTTRLISTTDGKSLYVLAAEGNVYQIDLPSGTPKKILDRAQFAGQGAWQFLGICLDHDGRLYLVGNHFDLDARPQMNRVTIFRTAPATI